MKNIRTIQFWY